MKRTAERAQRTKRTFASLGLPSALATVVPAIELALGAGLVLAPGVEIGRAHV